MALPLREVHIRRFKGIDDVRLTALGETNAFCGRNNSGKSTILHALDMAGLALTVGTWDAFQPMREVRDLFKETGPFEITLAYQDGSEVTVKQQSGSRMGPEFGNQPTPDQRISTIYLVPDPGLGLLQRHHVTPRNVIDWVRSRNFLTMNGMDMLFALRYYAGRNERGFTQADYDGIIAEVRGFFPDIEEILADRTEDDYATLSYREYGYDRDVIYAGAGLKHFVDILVKVRLSQANVVLIDEPEMGLHPSLQRELLTYFSRTSKERGVQFFLTTHSPVLLCDADKVAAFCVRNVKGQRTVSRLAHDEMYTIWADLGLRPGDLLQNDILVLVEGQKDVIVLDDVIGRLYREEFKDVAISVMQYGGDAAAGIISGAISVPNITPGLGHRLWLRDRDAAPGEQPSPSSTRFKHALEKASETCHILRKRQIEFYIPESAHVAAQGGDAAKAEAVRNVLNGSQEQRFCDSIALHECANLRGRLLRELLPQHLTKGNLDPEIRQLVEGTLIPWRNQIAG